MGEVLQAFLDSGWLTQSFAAIALGSTLVIIAVILSENRNPVKSLAWVTVLLLLPVVGLVLYIFFGRNIKNKRMISRRNRRKLKRGEKNTHVDPREIGLSHEATALINLGRSLSGAQLYANNTAEVFTDGKNKFDALLADIASARHSINLEYYIFSDDSTGRNIALALIEKARQGVAVRVIYDHVGSFSVRSRFFRDLRENGVEAHPFFKVSVPWLGTRVNWRNHRKICVIDGAIGYIGGMNIADRYIDGGKFAHWRDTHVRVTGPIVKALQYSFAVDWNFMGRGLIDLDDTHSIRQHIRPSAEAIDNIAMQLLSSGPMSQWSNIALTFLKAIANARRRVFIQTPYFLPDEALLKAIQTAALAHVDVRIIIPRKGDSWMLTHASASYISECLKAGIKIYLYDKGMLHSKMMIVDDEIVTIGSTNFDFRSFDYNFESNLFFFSRKMTAIMLNIFKTDLADSTRIQPARWRRRSLGDKTAESILRLLSPVL